VRGRATAAAVLVVAVALAGAAAAFVLLLQRDLIATTQAAAAMRVNEVSAQIRHAGLAGLDQDIRASTRTGQLVQVVDAAGTVVSSSSQRASSRPLTRTTVAPGQVVDVQASRLPLLDDDDPYLLVVGGVRATGAEYRVIVATPITTQQQSVKTALSLLLIGTPLLLVLVAIATWVLVGRTLDPVERIRRRVSEIGGSNVEEPIPVPDTDDEIAGLATTMNEMLGRLHESQRRQRRFIADASHELRSPLSTLTASVELARADPTGEVWDELSGVVAGEITRMTRLVADLLLLAKADERGLRLDLQEVDLDDLVDAEADRLRAVAAMTVEREVSPARVHADAVRLGQAVTNVVDNAARHAASAVVLRLAVDRTGPDGPVAVITVDDDGPGVPPQDRERVFDRFVRLDDSRVRASGGSGLGLAIVREVVVAHGGTVTIATSPAGGCRVQIRLPQAQDSLVVDA
jgi:signal transduction histidine kinase